MPLTFVLTPLHELVSGLRRPQTLAQHTLPPHTSSVLFVAVFTLSFILSSLSEAGDVDLSAGWVSWRYPDPRSDPDECGWTNVIRWAGDSIRNMPWLCDPDHVLGNNEAYNLALELERYHRESQCDCSRNCSHEGYQIAVALVRRLNTDGKFEPMKMKAKEFAKEVRTTWFADYGCDDNVLIFYSVFDDVLYISLGEKTKNVISDIELVRLNDIGNRHLTGLSLSTLSPRGGALHSDGDFTIALPTTNAIEKPRSTTYDGLDTLITEVHIAIVNGPSISSSLIYSAVVPAMLVLIILTMCLLANWCCAPAYGYHQPAQRPSKQKDESEEV